MSNSREAQSDYLNANIDLFAYYYRPKETEKNKRITKKHPCNLNRYDLLIQYMNKKEGLSTREIAKDIFKETGEKVSNVSVWKMLKRIDHAVEERLREMKIRGLR